MSSLKDFIRSPLELTGGEYIIRLLVIGAYVSVIAIFAGYGMLDYALYASEHNDQVIMSGSGQLYLIEHLDNCSRIGGSISTLVCVDNCSRIGGGISTLVCAENQYTIPHEGYVVPSKWDYVKDRVKGVIS